MTKKNDYDLGLRLGIFLSSFLILGVLPETTFAQNLCSDGRIYVNESDQKFLVGFRDYFPIKLSAARGCEISEKCSYDVIFISGDKEHVQYEGAEITDLCNAASERVGAFQMHEIPKYNANPLASIYEYSRYVSLGIETTEGGLGIGRRDFAPKADGIGWQSPLLEDGGTRLDASIVAASTFEFTVSLDEPK